MSLGDLRFEKRSVLKVEAMVLILGRRIIREDSGIKDSPAVKRKVLLKTKPIWIEYL